MQAAIADINTGIISQVSTFPDGSTLPDLPDNQRWITDAQWASGPGIASLVGQQWQNNIPATFIDPPALQSMSQAAFAAALAPQLAKLFAASTSNAAVAAFMVQGLITDPITRAVAYPAMQQLEAAGILLAGTAVAIWG
jgi:hypothetical protein